MDDEVQIRRLIEDWAAAVHAGNMDGVLKDHAEDIVMFDVPPPDQGVRGIVEYEASWPEFFAWQKSGGLFEIESLEVTASTDVAYAFALLRCAKPEDLVTNPERRLRISFGLRKEGDRWVVSHEHHSYPLQIT